MAKVELTKHLFTFFPDLEENAYDVVYRHALDNAHGALAFGSTTGNLYVSEDRGDRWTCAANNLPPIYSVRFG